MVCEDLSNIFILDNSPSAYRTNPGTVTEKEGHSY